MPPMYYFRQDMPTKIKFPTTEKINCDYQLESTQFLLIYAVYWQCHTFKRGLSCTNCQSYSAIESTQMLAGRAKH